jgi:hypothetical protein
MLPHMFEVIATCSNVGLTFNQSTYYICPAEIKSQKKQAIVLIKAQCRMSDTTYPDSARGESDAKFAAYAVA